MAAFGDSRGGYARSGRIVNVHRDHAVPVGDVPGQECSRGCLSKVRTAFVGRGAELEQLTQALKAATSEARRRVTFVGGEAGIGKSAPVAEVARRAHHDGVVVIYGRCDEDLSIPDGPRVEALRHLVRHVPEELLAMHVADRGGELTRRVDLGHSLRDPPDQWQRPRGCSAALTEWGP